jgi:hypothetical protein
MLANIKATALQIFTSFVRGKQKAIAAFVIAAVGTFVARHGFTINASAASFLQSAFIGLLAHLSVFTTRNK